MRSHSFQMLGLRAVGNCCWDINMSKVRSLQFEGLQSASICVHLWRIPRALEIHGSYVRT